MDINKKNAIVTLWIGTTVLLALFFFLPDKADSYFLSLRVFHHEKQIVQMRSAEPVKTFGFFRRDKDDARVLEMLEARVHNDGKWLVIYLGFIVLGLNTLACVLYAFNMRPWTIAAWVSGFMLITGAIVLQSYVGINP